MADITMCCNIKCSMKDSCYRFLADASSWQSYADFKDKDGKCDDYIKYIKIDKK